ncbi:universal stress protein [Natronorubrum sp. DTA28]|uniref:universal stress protein n=1 Tax=Natronorubrum sp. DTA28 TaxID=3447019 RepID=UPI003F82F346
MTTHVLVPLDGSDLAWQALEYTLEWYDSEHVSVLYVVDPADGIYTGPEAAHYEGGSFDRALERGEAVCDRARNRFEEHDETTETGLGTAVETGQPARTIVRYAEEHDADQIVMGSHGRGGVSRLLLGSVAETVTRRASVPVTIVR